LNGLIGIVAQPQLMGTVGTGKDEYTCRVGFLYGTFVKRFCTVGWAMVGLMVAALVARGAGGLQGLHDPEEAFGYACRHFLFTGGVGLLIACVLAANMAGCSAFMVDSGALFTRNFYRKYLAKAKSDTHYLWVGRISGVAVTLVAVIYALFFIKRVLYSFLLTETMATFVGVSVLGGVFWRRGTRWGAIASIAAAMGANFTLYHLRNQRLDHWDPNVFLVALACGVATYVIVSLLTPPEPAASMDSFYMRLETPSDGVVEEGHLTPPTDAEKRAYAEAGRQLILVNLFRLRKGAEGVPLLHAYWTDIKGFLIGWALAAGLVAMAWFIFNL
ncbi:MAG: hypothetical protein ABFD86_08480, partial [Bryobacteraceae bacterium]